MKSRLRRSCAVVAFFGLVTPAIFVANAQGVAQGPAESEDERALMEAVTVTARKREESETDVPASLTAFSAQELADIGGIDSLADLVRNTIGVDFSSATGIGSDNEIIIRGAGVGRFINSASTVGSYYNGAYIIGGNMGGLGFAVSDYFDTERIELLRGPQGAIYGRNAVGGAVNILSKRPGAELGGHIAGAYGDYDTRELEAVLNVPVTPILAVRGGFRLQEREEGYIYNPVRDEFVDRYRRDNYRLSALLKPTEKIDFLVSYDTLSLAEGGRVAINEQTPLVTANMVPGQTNPPGATNPNAAPQELYTSFENRPERLFQSFENWNAQLDVDLDWGQLTVIANRRDRFTTLFEDVDGGNGNGVISATDGPTEYKCSPVAAERGTDCFRFQYDDTLRDFYDVHLVGDARGGALNWTIGADYTEIRNAFGRVTDGSFIAAPTPFGIPGPAVGGPPGTFAQQNTSYFTTVSEDTSSAIYGAADYQLTDKIEAGIELRYTETDKRFSGGNFLILSPAHPVFCVDGNGGDACFDLPAAQTIDVDTSAKFENVAWTLYSAYALTDDANLYGRVGTGFREGGFNLDQRDPNFTHYDEESMISYEAGYRGRWLGGRMKTTAAVYLAQYEDFLTNTSNGCAAGRASADPGFLARCDVQDALGAVGSDGIEDLPAANNLLINTGDAEIFGIEFESEYLTEFDYGASLKSSLGISYQRGEITDGRSDITLFAPGRLPDEPDRVGANGDLDGLELPRLPEWQVSLDLFYLHPISALQSDGLVNFNIRTQSGGWDDVGNYGKLVEPTLGTLRIGLRGETWEVTGRVDNLFDEDEPVQRNAGPPSTVVVPREPRTFSIEFRKSF